MKDPINPQLAETQLRERFENKIKQYKETYETWQRVKAEPCDCDRMSCGRCMHLWSLEKDFDSILYDIRHY